MHRVFVYGTLKRGQPNNYLMKDCHYVGLGQTVDQWPLVITTGFNVPFLLPAKGNGKQVWGEIYDVSDDALRALDALEEHPDYYRRLPADIEIKEDSLGTRIQPRPEKIDTYFLQNFNTKLLNLRMFENYDTSGDHGQPYVAPWERHKGWELDSHPKLEVQTQTPTELV